MKMSENNITDQTLDVGYEEFLPFFDGFSEGLLIVDRIGTSRYYNTAMADIDELEDGNMIIAGLDLAAMSASTEEPVEKKEEAPSAPRYWGAQLDSLHLGDFDIYHLDSRRKWRLFNIAKWEKLYQVEL